MKLAFDPTLYLVTDSTGMEEERFLKIVESACENGVTMVQLREKEREGREFLQLAEKLLKLTWRRGIPLLIDDRADIALASGAQGVHVGQGDLPVTQIRRLLGPDKIVGASAKTVDQALAAWRQGADYLGVGAIFPTTTKVKTTLTQTDTLNQICGAVPIPVLAIGGLTEGNCVCLKESPIQGICVVSAIMKAPDPGQAAAGLRKAAERLVDCTEKPKNSAALERSEKPENPAALYRCEKLVRRAPSAPLETGHSMPAVLTVAGSDSSGGAGIQADLKTMTAYGCYGMSVITALTAQNTIGVQGILEISSEFVEKQLDSVFADILPQGVKIGMIGSAETAELLARTLIKYESKNIVLDPVRSATSGSQLIREPALDALKKQLFPLAAVVTPNIPEAQWLTGRAIHCEDDRIQAAKELAALGCGAVLIKGGHGFSGENPREASDLLYIDGETHWFTAPRISTENTHGTGCTLSSAMACGLAMGLSLPESVKQAKEYVTGAILREPGLGKGTGPLNHCWQMKESVI